MEQIGSRSGTKLVFKGISLFGLLGIAVVPALFPSAATAESPARPGALPDGWYPNAVVEGRVVPMIHVKDNGNVVLVDTDGVKPRTWEEQYKRKGDIPFGVYNVHKTDFNGSNTFADKPVDRIGLWTIDTVAHVEPGFPLADGHYENVLVEGRAVPMIHVKDNGATVLVDTVGTSPRRWNEQFKRKGDLPAGTYNLHKTSAEGTETFANLPIDRQGVWVFDDEGNLNLR